MIIDKENFITPSMINTWNNSSGGGSNIDNSSFSEIFTLTVAKSELQPNSGSTRYYVNKTITLTDSQLALLTNSKSIIGVLGVHIGANNNFQNVGSQTYNYQKLLNTTVTSDSGNRDMMFMSSKANGSFYMVQYGFTKSVPKDVTLLYYVTSEAYSEIGSSGMTFSLFSVSTSLNDVGLTPVYSYNIKKSDNQTHDTTNGRYTNMGPIVTSTTDIQKIKSSNLLRVSYYNANNVITCISTIVFDYSQGWCVGTDGGLGGINRTHMAIMNNTQTDSQFKAYLTMSDNVYANVGSNGALLEFFNLYSSGNPFDSQIVLFEKRFKTSDLDSNKQYYQALTSTEQNAVLSCKCILFELSYYGTNTSGAFQTVGSVIIDRVSHHNTNIRAGVITYKAGIDDDTRLGAMSQLRIGDSTSDHNLVKVLFQATTAYINDQWSPNHLWEMRAIKMA